MSNKRDIEITEILSKCYREFCDVVGDGPAGCDACPYGDSETCYDEYISDKWPKK